MADLLQSIDTCGFHESIHHKLSSESGCDSLPGEIIELVTFVRLVLESLHLILHV